MALLTWMTCWVLSRSMMLWAPRVTLIELHREQKGRGCHRRNGPGARRKEHSLGQGRGRVWQNSRQWALGLSISKLSAPWCLGMVAVSVVHGGCSVLLELDYL